MPVYILTGQDGFSRDGKLQEIKDGLGDKEMVAANTTVFDGKSMTFNDLVATCSTVPFLAPKRLVVVEGLLSQFEWRGARGRRPAEARTEQKEAEWRPLKSFLGVMTLTTVLVFIEGPLSRGNPLLQEVSPLATVAQFPVLRGEKLPEWIRTRLTGLGATATPSAVQTLANLIGGDLRQMESELEKLALYAQDRRITDEDVRLLVASAREVSIFALVDAMFESRPAMAIRLAHEIQQQGEKVSGILAMLTRQARLLLQAKDMLAKGIEEEELAARLGLTSEFIFKKTTGLAQRYSRERLERVYRKLLDVDLSIKTGRTDEGLALDMLAMAF